MFPIVFSFFWSRASFSSAASCSSFFSLVRASFSWSRSSASCLAWWEEVVVTNVSGYFSWAHLRL